MLFDPHSRFWLSTICNRSNAFCRQLACVAVDEAHLIWGWREFRAQYSNVGILQTVFPKVPIMAMSATFTPNILEYVRKTLNMRPPIQLYRRPLDRPNITYTVTQITPRSKFWDLNFLIPDIGGASAIEKTMIFVDSIFEDIDMAKYLRSLLPAKLQGKARRIIRTLYSVLETDTKTTSLEDFLNGDTRILMCTNAAGMGVDIPDIKRVVQWKLAEHLNLATVVQRLGRAGRKQTVAAVGVIFVNDMHILPKDMDKAAKEFAFARLPVKEDTQEATQDILSAIYDGNMQIRKEGDLSTFHKVDSPLL